MTGARFGVVGFGLQAFGLQDSGFAACGCETCRGGRAFRRRVHGVRVANSMRYTCGLERPGALHNLWGAFTGELVSGAGKLQRLSTAKPAWVLCDATFIQPEEVGVSILKKPLPPLYIASDAGAALLAARRMTSSNSGRHSSDRTHNVIRV